MTDYYSLLTGYPIYIATQEFQRRKHKKKRINKKWRKKYGTIELNNMPHGQILFNEIDRAFYMTKKTFQEFEKMFFNENNNKTFYMTKKTLQELKEGIANANYQ